jgi:hypothetical protein
MDVDKVIEVTIQHKINNQISCRSEWETGFAQHKFRPGLVLR